MCWRLLVDAVRQLSSLLDEAEGWAQGICRWTCQGVHMQLAPARPASVGPCPSPQIGRLHNLQHLHLISPWEEAGSCAELAQLPSLETLKLTGGVGEMPRCLSAFTQLRALTVDCCKGMGSTTKRKFLSTHSRLRCRTSRS